MARAGLLVATIGVAATAMAQSVEDDGDISSSNLNLPANASFLTKTDPNVHKATAIVNGDVITDTDVDQRLALVLVANSAQPTAAERQQLRLQILRNLIDESLEIQEAKANDITVTDDEINQTLDRIAGQFKQTPAKFPAWLHAHGSSVASLKRQIQGELAWNRLLRRKVEPFVNVSDDEVKAVMARMEAEKGSTEYHVGEIYLSFTPENRAQVEQNAQRIVEAIHGGGSFANYAKQYSEASTRSVGGDLGWVHAEQLPAPLAEALKQMPVNSVSAPIPLSSGFDILALIDQRQVLGSDPNDAVLSLKQVTVTFPANTTEAAAQPKAAQFQKAMQGLTGCGSVDRLASTVGGDVVQNDSVRLGDLPPGLRGLMVNLQVGQATPVFGSVKDGIRVLVLCGRDDPKTDTTPNYDQIYNQMESERVNLRARRYLRDLRRDAVIDYR